MFNLLYLIALPSLFLLVLCGLYGLALAVLGQKEKALTERQSRGRMQNGVQHFRPHGGLKKKSTSIVS